MTQKILVPSEWEKLSVQEKELAKKWIKSILEAEISSKNFLKLLSRDQFSATTITELEDTSIQEDDLEVVVSRSEPQAFGRQLKSDSNIDILQKIVVIMDGGHCQKHPNDPICKLVSSLKGDK
jgi:hypothetical protein